MAAACRGQGVRKPRLIPPVSTFSFSGSSLGSALDTSGLLRRDVEPVCTDSANKDTFLPQHPTPNFLYRETPILHEGELYGLHTVHAPNYHQQADRLITTAATL